MERLNLIKKLKSLVWIPSFQPSWCWYEYQGKKQVKNYSDKEFFKQMNSSVFGKTMEIATKHGDVKLLKIEKRKKLFGAGTKLSYYKVFHWKFVG